MFYGDGKSDGCYMVVDPDCLQTCLYTGEKNECIAWAEGRMSKTSDYEKLLVCVRVDAERMDMNGRYFIVWPRENECTFTGPGSDD